ncbi:MAG: tRNA lysidine(34) synthetase TilS [Myxococcales bacterium]|nr:tRNA lysidine(34) synthetase TilS [Myxococcales bacterium]
MSGGGDSVAMLHALSALGQCIAAAHVHHGLRGASAELDLELVRERSAKLGVRFLEARVDVRIPDGRSPEARARVLRYAALERLRADHGFAFIATGHTLDDQAETLLLRAIRGTSPGGLSGIAARAETEAGAPVLRPLLSLRREALRNYLRTRGLTWREDPGNCDPGVPRSRVRRDVLPVLEQIHPGATERLAALAGRAQSDEAWLSRQAKEVLDRAVLSAGLDEPGSDAAGFRVRIAPLAGLDRPLRLRALAQVLCRAGLVERLSGSHLDRLDRFIRGAGGGRSLSLPADSLAVRDSGCLVIRRDRQPSAVRTRGSAR